MKFVTNKWGSKLMTIFAALPHKKTEPRVHDLAHRHNLEIGRVIRVMSNEFYVASLLRHVYAQAGNVCVSLRKWTNK